MVPAGRQVQVSGQAQLAAYLYCANRVFLLSKEIMFRAVGAGRSQPRRGKPEAERNPVPRDRGDRVPPRPLTHAVKLPQANHRPGSGITQRLRTGQPTGHPNDALDTAAMVHLAGHEQ